MASAFVRAECMLKVEEHPCKKAKFPVIDMHSHWGPILLGPDYAKKYETKEVVENLKKYNIEKIFNLDLIWDESLAKMEDKTKDAGDYVVTCPSVDITKCEDPDFPEYVDKYFKKYKEEGRKAIKLWKNMTLYWKASNGKYKRLDDPDFEPLWTCAAKYGLPLIIHIGDPHALFTPATPSNEYYDILKDHPEWVFVGDDYFTFDEHMEMQENIIKNHPDTTFVVAHIGSCGEDLSRVDAMMDKYPNMYIDIAARISEIGRQPYTSRKFFIKHQDKIMFGTDYEANQDPEVFYPPYFRFLETFDEYFDYMGEPRSTDYGNWKIYGIGLEDDVLKKIYSENAKKVFKL